jgi:putative sigma-54 modulation protein
MDLVVKGKNMDVTDSLREYAQQKIGRITKIFDDIIDAQVALNVVKNKSVHNNQIVEVTLHLSGGVIRGEEAKDNMYAAIDLVTDKLERQLRRFKGKHRTNFERTKTSSGVLEMEPAVAVVEVEEFEEESDTPQIVRNKQIEIKPMSPEEAARQMEMLGHDFFVFRNPDSNDDISVLYRRRDGHYGLIEPVNA